jgi:hypothetical protein
MLGGDPRPLGPARQRARVERDRPAAAEDQPAAPTRAEQVGGQVGAERGDDRHRPRAGAALRFHRPNPRVPRAADAGQPGFEVDVVVLERLELAEPQARVGGGRPSGAVVFGQRLNQARRLLRPGEAFAAPADRGQAYSGGRVDRQFAALDGAPKDDAERHQRD